MKKQLKLLIILVPRFDPFSGGVQMSTYKLSKFFAESGLDVSVFSFENVGHKPPKFVEFFHADNAGVNYDSANMNKCRKVVQSINPDIVINQMPYEFKMGDMLREQADLQGFKLFGCLRGSFFAVIKNIETYRKTLLPGPLQPFFKNGLGYWLLKKVHIFKHGRDLKHIIDTYDKYVLFGDANRKELEFFIGKYKQNKLAYIANSIPKVLQEVPEKQKRILWLSRVDYRQKHAELIIPLWKLLKDSLPDYEFDLVGDGGALKDIREQADNENLERFIVYGKQKPDEFYRRSPIYIMTSSFEGFPNTLIEAQSFASIPVVFDSYPMIREIVKDDNAVLVETFNIKKMATEIVELLKDEFRRKNMASNCIKNANRYTIDKVGMEWIKLFKA
jgi:glycosyltransferase involved in cell wall biosynthesis